VLRQGLLPSLVSRHATQSLEAPGAPVAVQVHIEARPDRNQADSSAGEPSFRWRRNGVAREVESALIFCSMPLGFGHRG